MKDATLTGQTPRTDDEYKAEIDRLLGEVGVMLENTRRNQESTARKQAATWESIRWLEARIHVGETA